MKKFFLRLSRYHACEQGGILITWAIILPVVVGMLGLGAETGTWYLTKRKLQSAADAGAIAGAYQNNSSARTTSATSAVSANGFGNGSNVTVTVNNPPLTGTYTANSNAVEVILSQPQTRMFSGIFSGTSQTITTRSVALGTSAGTGNGCVVALSTSGSDAILLNGGASINSPSCFVASNSNSANAIYVNGGSSMNVQSLYTMGTYGLNGGSTLSTTVNPTINATTAITDPYAGLTVPAIGACPGANKGYTLNGGASATINPGVYCNGFTINGGSHVTLNPGTYIMDRGSFLVNGGSTLTGTGVTIILTSSTGANYATATINGGCTVTVSAPTSGTYSGVAFYQDGHAPTNNAETFNGGSTMNITGALYFPKGALTFNGGNSAGSPSCTQVIGYTLLFNGGSNLSGTCVNSGMTTITKPGGSMTVSLKE